MSVNMWRNGWRRAEQRKRWIVRPCVFAWERTHRIPCSHKGRERATFCRVYSRRERLHAHLYIADVHVNGERRDGQGIFYQGRGFIATKSRRFTNWR
ncbi:hypothetical protein PUN28_005274 [Cardiocondyla obscurior]|uniref:Uncharacterized protein n=1 Tax=Cardiocondyla obscurior TaxID=286306 RepID=A0AAW2GHU0_9HYME